MSDNYKILAIGLENFVLPYGMSGFEFHITKHIKDAVKIINEYEFSETVFILDEDIIDDIKTVEEMEESGANIIVMKGWGRSELANNKIRNASIKAIGVDLAKENK
jgi:hypothetical protein